MAEHRGLAFGLLPGGLVLDDIPVLDANKLKIKGVPIALDRHPRLKGLIEDIATELGERVPSSVYLISDANAFVSQDGDLAGASGKRLMGLGM